MVEKALTAKAVGREFVRQYYTMLNKQPKFLHRFYGTNSEMIHGNMDQQAPAVGQLKIREYIRSLEFEDCYTKVASLDAFLTIGNGIVVQVAGEISNNCGPLRRFAQTFVLGPQERQGVEAGTSFYVHNDIFRYQDDVFEDYVAENGAEDFQEPAQNGVSSFEHQGHGDAPEPSSMPTMSPLQQEPEKPPVPAMETVSNGFEQMTTEPKPEPVQEYEPVQIEEPAVPEPEPVKEPEVQPQVEATIEVVEEVRKRPTSNAPISWAARMRGGSGPAPGNTGACPLLPPVVSQTIPAQPKPVEQAIPESAQKPIQMEPAEPAEPQQSRPHFDKPRFDDRCQIFVGALPKNMTEEDIKGVFDQFGEVKYIRINQGARDSRNGFGFVTFANEAAVQAALAQKNDITFNGYHLNIEEKKTRPREGGSRGGYRGRGGARGDFRGPPRGNREYNNEYRGGPNRGDGSNRPPRKNY